MNAHVLLVEDDPGDARIARKQLEAAPSATIAVVHERTLESALARLMIETYDVILLDLGLPDSRGIETVNRTKRHARTTPIIVMSGAARELRAPLIAAGVEEVLTKDDMHSWLFSRSVMYVIERERARMHHRDLEKLLEATPDAIVVATESSVVRYVNRAALRLFGVSRAALLGEPLGFSVTEGKPAEIEVPRADGARVCEMRVVPLDWNGEAAHLASIRDITEQRLSEALRVRADELELENRRVQELSRLKSEFLANMSHELRAPLNAIIGFAQLLYSGQVAPSAPEHDEFLGDILASGRHLLRLVNDVLDLAKVEAGRLDFRSEKMLLRRVIGEVVTMLRAIAAERQIALVTELDPSVEEIDFDPVRLKQILYNFLSNALKFTAEGGHVAVRTRAQSEQTFRLEVQDDGEGIAEADLGKLFVEFQQLEAGMSRRYQGTGLGLALTRRIVEARGGRVGVESTLGLGSTFFAVLPRRASASTTLELYAQREQEL